MSIHFVYKMIFFFYNTFMEDFKKYFSHYFLTFFLSDDKYLQKQNHNENIIKFSNINSYNIIAVSW